MDKPILLTSIPPYLKRAGKNEEMYGIEYMQFCVNSWINAGFLPISINSNKEFSTPPSHITGVKYILVDRDASLLVGKPLVYINDMLRIGADLSKGPFILTNADIFFRAPYNITEELSKIRAGEFLAERRIDISETKDTSGDEYAHGFDLFAFHPEDIANHNDEKFIFGVPWWDHYLPLKFILSGMERAKNKIPLIYHLKHKERWSADLWETYGKILINEISKEIEKLKISKDQKKLTYKNNFFNIINNRKTPLSRLIYLIKHPKYIKGNQSLYLLNEIAHLNMQFIESHNDL